MKTVRRFVVDQNDHEDDMLQHYSEMGRASVLGYVIEPDTEDECFVFTSRVPKFHPETGEQLEYCEVPAE